MSDDILNEIKNNINKIEKNVNQLKKDRDMYQELIKNINKEISNKELILSELKQKFNTFDKK